MSLANQIYDDIEDLPLPLPPPPTHHKSGINPAFAVGGGRELPPSSSLPSPTAKAGTHPACGVGPRARWAESDFPTAIN